MFFLSHNQANELSSSEILICCRKTCSQLNSDHTQVAYEIKHFIYVKGKMTYITGMCLRTSFNLLLGEGKGVACIECTK